jgi:putative ABC transport system permease protein
MKTLIKISWRNVWRNKARSLVIILAIAFGLWGGIVATAIFTALVEQQFDSSIKNQVSHIQVHNPDFLKDRNTLNSITHHEQVAQTLSAEPGVTAYSSRILASGMLASASMTSGVEIFGVDPVMEENTRKFSQNIIEGEYLDISSRNPVLVGAALAKKMKINTGTRVVLTFQDARGDITAAAFRVAGIYRTANSMHDERNVLVNKNDLEAILGKSGIVNEIAILMENLEWVNPVAKKLQDQFPDITVRTWGEISPELTFMNELSGIIMMILVIIILLALAFGLLNTMLMTIFERTRELGVLMSVGMNKARVFSMILLETSFITFTGSAVGILIGSITVLITHKIGIDFTRFGADTLSEFGFDAIIYPRLDTSFFGYLALLVILTATLASVYPAYKALKLNPAEAVRKE